MATAFTSSYVDTDGKTIYELTRTNEQGEEYTVEFIDPDCKLSVNYYHHLSISEIKAFTIANRHRVSTEVVTNRVEAVRRGIDKHLDNPRLIEDELVLRALNFLHSRLYPQHSRPAGWFLAASDRRNPDRSEDVSGRKFKYVTTSGKQFGFSLTRSLKSYEKAMVDDFKAAIKPQLKEYKEEFFSHVEKATDSLCAECDRQCWNDGSSQVDHVIEFAELLDQWIDFVDAYRGDFTRTDDPKKDYNIAAFEAWHRKVAKLRIICTDCNQRLGREYMERRVAEGRSRFGKRAA